jgi:hypothetical protein
MKKFTQLSLKKHQTSAYINFKKPFKDQKYSLGITTSPISDEYTFVLTESLRSNAK